MPKPAPRTLQVLHAEQITPHMRRITLGGAEMHDFPKDQESAYIKLLFDQAGSERPLMRTYTIRTQRDTEIDVDFVVHEQTGIASQWALDAQIGDTIRIGGPGPAKLMTLDADWFLLAGDMTALPAISVNLEKLPADATGYAVIEIASEMDKQDLVKPAGVEVIWVINATTSATHSPLLEQIRALTWQDGQPSVWVACEFHSMRQLRDYFKHTRSVSKSHLYVSSYWKIDRTEDEHKVDKRQDSDAHDASS
ncbi:siderophore-interacting protein [Psychrobacter aestuarii]|uniref:Siderophore-interacting protein n=1 Tax=Psychrobacter aestuarii TaxID=556327 RepID=A0ABN0VN12_9GAMM|nr:siderophore-interacting protein [Psychrobacter aestuarii]